MFIPGWACILGGLFIINRLRDTPQSLGLPPIEKFKGEVPANKKVEEENSLSVKDILLTYVLRNKFILDNNKLFSQDRPIYKYNRISNH